MYRARARACPSCARPMVVIRLGGGESPRDIDRCEGCGCVFIEWVDGEPGAVARALLRRPDAPATAAARFEPGPACPDCDDAMQCLPYLDEGPPVWRCHACLALLATPAQLALLAEFRVLAAERAPGLVPLFVRVARALGLPVGAPDAEG